jgi:hypothetical protein
MEKLASLTSMSFLASCINFAEAGDIKAFVIQKYDSSVADISSEDGLVLRAAHLDEEDEEFLFRSPKFDDDLDDEDEDEDEDDEDEDFDDEDED